MILKSIRTIAVVVLAMVGVNAYSQDLLASQAPVDKKMKAIDSVALQRQIQKEKMEYQLFIQVYFVIYIYMAFINL